MTRARLYRIGDRFYIAYIVGGTPTTLIRLCNSTRNRVHVTFSTGALTGNGSDVKDSILVLLLHVARCAMNHMGVIDARSLNAVAERAAPLPERR